VLVKQKAVGLEMGLVQPMGFDLVLTSWEYLLDLDLASLRGCDWAKKSLVVSMVLDLELQMA